MLDTTCDDKCILEVRTSEGETASQELGEFRVGRSEMKVGGGPCRVDSTTVKSDPFAPTKIEDLCNRLRIGIMSRYFWMSIPVLIAGALSFLVVTTVGRRKAIDDVLLSSASACLAAWFSCGPVCSF